jgi:hypothetical protein
MYPRRIFDDSLYRNGDLYLAKTNRYLSETGTIGLHAYSRFKPFKTNSLPLDLLKSLLFALDEGGYFGIKGEQISFTTQMRRVWF